MREKLSAIVYEVGKKLIIWREHGPLDGVWVGEQYKTYADVQAHNLLVKLLNKLNPLIPIVSEEDDRGHTNKRPQKYFLIDPIDGTASYAGGFSGFVTQVAYIENSQTMISAIYAPAFDQMYLAERNVGSTCNGKILRCNIGDSRRLIDNYPTPRGIVLDVYQRLNFSQYIESGSIALKICRIADGTADFFFKNVTVRDWDVAAPSLVLTEAGGIFTSITGQPYIYNYSYEKDGLIATALPALIPKFLEVINSH